jgi:hypothetical protein
MAPTHPHGQVENATASSAGGSPDGEATEVTENTEARVGIGRTGNISATALDSRQWIIFPQSRFGSGHGPNPPPWPGRKRHRVLCGRLSGWGWGGLAQRRRGAEEGIGRTGNISATALDSRQRIIFPQSRFGSGHGPNPPPWPGRKRHRVLCGRLSGWRWGDQVGKAATFSDGLGLGLVFPHIDHRLHRVLSDPRAQVCGGIEGRGFPVEEVAGADGIHQGHGRTIQE